MTEASPMRNRIVDLKSPKGFKSRLPDDFLKLFNQKNPQASAQYKKIEYGQPFD